MTPQVHHSLGASKHDSLKQNARDQRLRVSLLRRASFADQRPVFGSRLAWRISGLESRCYGDVMSEVVRVTNLLVLQSELRVTRWVQRLDLITSLNRRVVEITRAALG